jgi:hypothetical protein
MRILIGETSGATGEEVDCGGHCLSSFNDLRFTASDGETLLPYWIESISGTTPNQLATVWVKFDSIGTGDTTFYMYYGNAAAAAYSDGADTFLVFDDFERGSNLDTIGGDWTETVAHVHISTEQKYGGSRGAMLVGLNGSNPAATIATGKGNDIAIRMMTYKENAAELMTFVHGNGTNGITVKIAADEKIQYYDGAWKDTGSSGAADAWRLIEVCNFDWSMLTYDIYYNGSLIKSAADMRTLLTNDGTCKVQGDATSGNDGWIDNFIVRSWLATEAVFGSWGAAEMEADMGAEAGVKADFYGATALVLEDIEGNAGVNVAVGAKGSDFHTSIESGLGVKAAFAGSAEALEAISNQCGMQASFDGFNWTDFLQTCKDRINIRYSLAVSDPSYGPDIVVPISSFQGRFRSGDPTFLSVVVPGNDQYADISAREDGELILTMQYVLDGAVFRSEEMCRVDIEEVRLDYGSQSVSVTISGHKTVTNYSKTVQLTGESYKAVYSGKIHYRCTPDLYLRPGDTCIVGDDSFVAGTISWFVTPDSVTMEIAEEGGEGGGLA